MKKIIPFITLLVLGLGACKNGAITPDATGTFEAEEVIVSAEAAGRILDMKLQEGATLRSDSIIGQIDAMNLSLQKEQVEASIASLSEKTADVSPQVLLLQNQLAVQQTQLENLLHEQNRIQNLLKADAATGKQFDDIVFQINMIRKQMDVTRQQIQVQRNAVATQNRSIFSEKAPLQKKISQIEDQLNRSNIVNPINGTVLTQYARAGEITAPGKALYKIADLSELQLRAYFTAPQLSSIKLGQTVTVLVDEGAKSYKEMKGTITWIADKAEFTPKTIQTKEERANLVYAVKVKVKNDGTLKIGMYGEIKLK